MDGSYDAGGRHVTRESKTMPGRKRGNVGAAMCEQRTQLVNPSAQRKDVSAGTGCELEFSGTRMCTIKSGSSADAEGAERDHRSWK